ncbi:MAG: hypothetical protein F4Y01_08395 [Gammaproteobacteria bacterium]|nr:hypothetical protein [Gammaproteobacteria bacterium]
MSSDVEETAPAADIAAAEVVPESPSEEHEDFPGCDPVPMSWDDVLAAEGGRIWYWDGDTQTAWVVRDGSADHEVQGSRLASLMTRIALERGTDIHCFGSVYLMLRQPDGRTRRMMAPDQAVFLRPREPGRGDGIALGRDRLPDVVFETDHTTDVQRRKLGIYEQWGFPELWVDVPDAGTPSRPSGLGAGLTIHILEDGKYRRAPKSRAMPGWSAEAIHVALNEPSLSRETMAELARVGRELGASEGTTPEDDLQIRGHRRDAHRVGLRQGRTMGLREGQLLALRRIASRKFAAEFVSHLFRGLDQVEDVEVLAEVGLLIVDCSDAEELERQLAKVLR